MLFWKAFAIGLSIAAPVGPIGVLCIQRSLRHGWRSGFAAGLGAASADGLYGLAGALGSGTLIAVLVAQRAWIGIAGGLFLVALGWRAIRATGSVQGLAGPPAESPCRAARGADWATFAGTFALTLSNPMTILAFVAIFASIGATLARPGSPAAIATMVSGVFLGSASWWLFLSASVTALRGRLPAAALDRINQASGTLLVLLGLWQIWLAA